MHTTYFLSLNRNVLFFLIFNLYTGRGKILMLTLWVKLRLHTRNFFSSLHHSWVSSLSGNNSSSLRYPLGKQHHAWFNALLMGFILAKVPVWFMPEGIHNSRVDPMLTGKYLVLIEPNRSEHPMDYKSIPEHYPHQEKTKGSPGWYEKEKAEYQHLSPIQPKAVTRK